MMNDRKITLTIGQLKRLVREEGKFSVSGNGSFADSPSSWSEIDFGDGRMEEILDMERKPVTGYLLEVSDDGKLWKPYEFDTQYESNWYEADMDSSISRDWLDNKVFDGYFEELPGVLLVSSFDWEYRLGVDFDPEKTPDLLPPEEWNGYSDELEKNWRVRKTTVSGKLGDKAKEFFLNHPEAWVRHMVK